MPLKFEMVLQDHCRKKKKHHALLFKGTGDKYFCLTVGVLESLSRGLGWGSGYETYPSHSVVFLGKTFYFEWVSLQPGTSYLKGG